MSERRPVETADPEEAFAALADNTRVDILRALWDAEDHRASFSELREAVGMRDSGQFNYHLDRLVGGFVRKTDDGYELTLAGMHVNGAIEGGAYTMEGELDPVDLDDPCPACGGARTFRYEGETVRIDCADCSFELQMPVPPGVFAEYDPEAAPAVASRYFRTVVEQTTNGFCWYCDGPLEPTVRRVAEAVENDDPAGDIDDLPLVEYECERCGNEMTVDLGSVFVEHPAVAGFYFDRGVNVRDRPFYTFAALDPELSEVRERDPLRASVSFEADEDRLTLVVDERCEVLAVERGET